MPGYVFSATVDGEIEFVNHQLMEYTGRAFEELKNWTTSDLIHPEDLPRVLDELRRSIETGQSEPVDHRVLSADGRYRWFQVRRVAERDSAGRIVRWYLELFDIHDRKETEEKLRQSEADLFDAQRMSLTCNWKHNLASGRVTVSPEAYRTYGVTSDEDPTTPEFWFYRVHPDDQERNQRVFERSETNKTDYQDDYRIVLPDRSIKHLHAAGHPILNEGGELIEFIGTAMDVTEQVQARAESEAALGEVKLLRDQLYEENLALRDEVDRASMFEEIIGTSAALQRALSLAVKVAPTTSSVLITGGTGTGKELMARAVHKRSARANRAFISELCRASVLTDFIRAVRR